MDGQFSLTNLKKSDKLVITYVGMKSVEVAVAPEITVKMEETDAKLDEVIVTAFGTAKKSSFTGSATVIGSNVIEQKQVTNVMQSLMGEVPGLEMAPSTSPGSTTSIVIRGKGSLNAGTEPLVVVDGMPYEGGWNNINPQDVANVTVLKDAASSALYGARGANGVIIITTKSGSPSKVLVNLDAKWGANSRSSRDYDRITNPGQYYELYYKAIYNNLISAGLTPEDAYRRANENLCGPAQNGGLGYCVYTVPEGERLIGRNGQLNPNAVLGNRIYRNGQFYTLLPDDWTKETYQTGFRQEYNLSISGGNSASQVYASLGYLKDDGIVKASAYERVSGRLRATYQATKWFNFGANMAYTHSINSYAYDLSYGGDYVTGGVFSDAANVGPVYPLYVRDADGNIMTDQNGVMYDWGDGKYNTDGMTRPSLINTNSLNSLSLDYYRTVSNNTMADAFGDITLPAGFKLTLKGGTSVTERRVKAGVNPYYGYSSSTGGSLSISHSRTTTVNFQQLLNWNRTYDGHNVSVLLGHESYNYNYETLSASKEGAVDYKSLTELNGYLNYPNEPSSYSQNYNTEGYISRAMYDYKERYFAQGSFRRDASSRFSPDNRWGNFWSIGGAWILSREEWFTARFVNNLKFKISYGEVGNDNIGYYRYIDTWDINNVDGDLSLSLRTKGNKDISWEKLTNLNAGVEFDLFDYRLSGSVEFYNKMSNDMLLWFTAPSSLGYSGYYKNIGDMRNRGFDMTLSGSPVRTKGIEWGLSMNFNYNDQSVTYLPQANKSMTVDGYEGYQSGNDYFVGEGLPLSTFYIAKYAGVSDKGLSQWYYTDANGEEKVTTSYSNATHHIIKGFQPLRGGFGTTLKVYGFDLAAQFVFGIGGKSYDAEYAQLMTVPVYSSTGYAIHKDMLNAWSPENPQSEIPRWQLGDQYTGIISDRYLINSSYLSFQNAQVGYNLPARLIAKAGLSKLRVYVTGDNLLLFSHRKGFDPRLSAGYGSYSPMRKLSAGITIQF